VAGSGETISVVFTEPPAEAHWSRATRLPERALLAAAGLLLARALLALLAGEPPSGGSALVRWASEERTLLALANECLVIGAVVLAPGVLGVWHAMRDRPGSGRAGCATLMATVPVMVVLGIIQGRLVYPVYGIPLDRPASVELIASLYFGGEHTVLLMVAAAAVLVSLSVSNRAVRRIGYVAASAAVAASYPEVIGEIAAFMAHATISVWVFGLSMLVREERRSAHEPTVPLM
jgi:hypothetical protein